MNQHVIIDGNNLLHAMHALAPIPLVARETMVKIIERWARRGTADVTLVFDGPRPREGLARQMSSSRIDVRFSAPVTADDVIVGMIYRAKHPDTIRVISTDTAIVHEAKARRGSATSSEEFVAEVFAPEGQSSHTPDLPRGGKTSPEFEETTKEWMDIFGVDESEDDDDPFQGLDPSLR